MGELFAFVTEVEVNLLIDKAVPENAKKINFIALNVFDGKLCVSVNVYLEKCSNTERISLGLNQVLLSSTSVE